MLLISCPAVAANLRDSPLLTRPRTLGSSVMPFRFYFVAYKAPCPYAVGSVLSDLEALTGGSMQPELRKLTEKRTSGHDLPQYLPQMHTTSPEHENRSLVNP